MSKPSIIPSWKYQKPSKGGHKGLKKLLKYVSHRESPDHRPVDLEDRWVDCGLGANWREVYANAGKLAGPYVLAHHLVISPAPDLMQHLPEALRQDVVREVTERTIEHWHVNRGLSVPEYSYCVHDRDTNGDYGLQQLHTHVFVAGTIDNGLGERLSHRVNREQVCADRGGLEREDNLHHVARQEFEAILDRTLGIEWRHEREQDFNRDLSRRKIESDLTVEQETVEYDDDLRDAALREFQRLRDRGLSDEWRPEPGLNLDQSQQAFRQLLDRVLGIERQPEPDSNQEIEPAVTPEPERDHNRGRSVEIEAPAPDSDESIGRGWDMDR